MDILNMVFTGLFTVEMLLKLLALRLRVRNLTHLETAGSLVMVYIFLLTTKSHLQTQTYQH